MFFCLFSCNLVGRQQEQRCHIFIYLFHGKQSYISLLQYFLPWYAAYIDLAFRLFSCFVWWMLKLTFSSSSCFICRCDDIPFPGYNNFSCSRNFLSIYQSNARLCFFFFSSPSLFIEFSIKVRLASTHIRSLPPEPSSIENLIDTFPWKLIGENWHQLTVNCLTSVLKRE